MFCSQRLLGTQTEDKSGLYLVSGSLLYSSSGLPCTGVLGAVGRLLSLLQGQLCACCRVRPEPVQSVGGIWKCPWLSLCCPAAGRCWWLQPGLLVRMVLVLWVTLCVPVSSSNGRAVPWAVLTEDAGGGIRGLSPAGTGRERAMQPSVKNKFGFGVCGAGSS